MSERIVVEFDHVGKMYRLYRSRVQSFLDATSLGNLMPRWNSKINNFWALRNVSFKLKAGSRLGIVGRNGAGKTTLLKMMTGNIMPTEGSITVHGEVQALLEAGAGFHPEFSGYENIEASLIQNGFNRSQIKSTIEEIADFTELGDFLRQPFKTYSAGMQARLVFTTATAVHPDILIVDEILGAGDGYFAIKSRARMRALVESGSSVLLVSHALDQILQFCDEAIWLERGRIVLRGPAMEVVKAYEEFVHTLQDRQLKAANRQRKLGFRDAVEVGHFNDNFVVALSMTGSPGARADISTVELRREEIAEETLRIGDTQDTDQTYLSYVALANCQWSDPQTELGDAFRSLARGIGGDRRVLGEMVFRSYALEPGRQYAFRIRYRTQGGARLVTTVSRNGEAIIVKAPLPLEATEWQTHDLAIALEFAQQAGLPAPVEAATAERAGAERELTEAEDPSYSSATGVAREIEAVGAAYEAPAPSRGAANPVAVAAMAQDGDTVIIATGDGNGGIAAESGDQAAHPAGRPMAVRRWPGEGSLLIEDVVLQDGGGNERAVYRVGNDLVIGLQYRAVKTGTFPVICSLVIYRVDGVRVTQHVSAREFIDVIAGDRREIRLEFPSLDLADGRYIISVALHRELDPQYPDDTLRYDLIDRSYDFEVVGNPPLRTSLFVLPARWVRNGRET